MRGKTSKTSPSALPHARRSELQQKFENIDLDVKDVLEKKTIFANKYQYDSYTIYVKSRERKADPRKTIIADDLNTEIIIKIEEIITELWKQYQEDININVDIKISRTAKAVALHQDIPKRRREATTTIFSSNDPLSSPQHKKRKTRFTQIHDQTKAKAEFYNKF